MDKPDIVRAWCAQRVGCPYIYGATGKPCTPSYREARMAQYPAYAAKIKRNCPRMNGTAATCQGCVWADPETGEGKPAYDCAQLSRGAMEAVGIPMVSGANSQWQRTAWADHGDLADLPNELFGTVFLVFRYDADKKGMGHVGVYQGDGTVIHAKGHDWGVVRERLAETTFTHWGQPEGLLDGQAARPILRQGAKGEAVTLLQTMLCDVGHKVGVDGAFGPETAAAVKAYQAGNGLTVDGVVGPKTWDALERATAHQPDEPEQPDPDPDVVIIPRNDWNAIRAAVAVLHQAIKKYESVG